MLVRWHAESATLVREAACGERCARNVRGWAVVIIESSTDAPSGEFVNNCHDQFSEHA